MTEEKVEITSSWGKIEEDGIEEARSVFVSAISKIDKKFGSGYAKKHPELISAFMNEAAMAIQGTTIGKCLLAIRDSIDAQTERLGSAGESIAYHLESSQNAG